MEPKQETKIKKASLKEDVLEIEYEQIIDDPEQGPVINTFKLNGGNKPHQDLKDSLKNLRFHAAMICEQVPAKTKHEDGALEHYSVTGFSIGGSDENEGVTIIAQRKLASGQVLNLIAPFTKWESEYKHTTDLYPDVAIVLQECLNFLNGKYAPNPQLELTLEEKE